MELLKKLRDVVGSVLPIVAMVTICRFIVPLPNEQYFAFLLGSVFVVIGLTLFLHGVDIGIVPVGERIGASVMKHRSILLMIIIGFIVGFSVTFAEPNAEVLASQVALVNPSLNSSTLLLMISLGVGICIAIAFLRLVLHVSSRVLLAICYGVLFLIAFFSDHSLFSVAFDAGGAATGPLAVPFIMALGLGSAKVRSDATESDSFGFVSLQAVGAILAILVLGLFSRSNGTSTLSFSYDTQSFILLFASQWKAVAFSLLPLFVIILLFQLIVLHLPRIQFLRVVVGVIYSYIGEVFFLSGANGGFMPVAFTLGTQLAQKSHLLLIAIGFILGALVVLAEPSVKVLVVQVEEVSQGRIVRKMMETFLAVGVAVFLVIALLRNLYGFSLMPVFLVLYGVSFLMMFKGPKLFGAIAFDSGGVAAGPMASTFILPFVIGAGSATGGSDPFGALGCISLAPLITIQLFGLIYDRKVQKGKEAKT